MTPSYLKPALCLDLDGTVRYSRAGEFINQPEDIALYPGIEAKLWHYRDQGFLIFGISNQGGVAFGHKTPEGCEAEIAHTAALFKRNPFHIIKVCYNHPLGTHPPYNHRSLLRKPDIGMLALCELDAFEQGGVVVDWTESLMVGDRPEDQECAARAGIAFAWAHEFFGRSPLVTA
jgi:D-glycero-D-manno-heptose 1,7-bisphosphate phosphatase